MPVWDAMEGESPNFYYVYIAGCRLVTQGLTAVLGGGCPDVQELDQGAQMQAPTVRSGLDLQRTMLSWSFGREDEEVASVQAWNRTPKPEVTKILLFTKSTGVSIRAI